MTRKDGIPEIPTPNLGNGIIDIPGNVGVNPLADKFPRGYVQSWNLMLQKKLWWGFTGQAGYVATRQIRQLGFLDLNVGRVGGGTASRPFNQRFGQIFGTKVIGGTENDGALQSIFKLAHVARPIVMLQKRMSFG